MKAKKLKEKKLKESTFQKFQPTKEAKKFPAAHGIGTPVAGYSEKGPFSCGNCRFLKKKNKQGLGLCNEEHMKADPKVKKWKNGMAIVKVETGCCEYVDPGGKKK